MIVAEIIMMTGGFGDSHSRHQIGFDNPDRAREEYDRVAELLKRRGERANDLPETVEVDGASGTKITVPLDEIRSIGLTDFAHANERMAGVRDAFPNMFKV